MTRRGPCLSLIIEKMRLWLSDFRTRSCPEIFGCSAEGDLATEQVAQGLLELEIVSLRDRLGAQSMLDRLLRTLVEGALCGSHGWRKLRHISILLEDFVKQVELLVSVLDWDATARLQS